MKKWLPVSIIVLVGALAIFFAERQGVNTRPGPQALLQITGDTEHELSRIPLQLDHMSDQEEIQIGDNLAREYQQLWQVDDQERLRAIKVEQYLQKVGESVESHARRKLPYHFHYIAQDTFVNAFALPGGHIFVGAGLLKLIKSEDALSAVLGHEIEHVDLRHCTERIQMEAQLRHLGVLGDLLGLPVDIFTAGYSKQQELDADRYGTALAVAAGYSPKGILQLLSEFEKLERETENPSVHPPASPIDEALDISWESVQGYFRSHPPATERKIQIERLVLSEHWHQPALRPLEAF